MTVPQNTPLIDRLEVGRPERDGARVGARSGRLAAAEGLGYPLHMHDQVPPQQRARALNDLVCAAYEDAIPLDRVAIEEPLRAWLVARAADLEER